MQIAVMIACGAPAVMKETSVWLENAGYIRIVAVAASRRQAITEFVRHRPDVSLVDLPLLAQDDFASIATMRALHPATRVVALTDDYRDSRLGAALEAGAAAYALKDMLAENLARLVSSVYRKSDRQTRTVPAPVDGRHPADHLSRREVDVLRLASIGNSNRVIGSILGIGEATVKTHMSGAMGKLGASDRTHAVTLAIKRGYIRLQ